MPKGKQQYQYSTIKKYERGEIVIREGEVGDEVFIIRKGQAKIVKTDAQGNELVIDIVSEGKVFGEMGFILEQPRSRTVRALTELEVEIIDPRVFGELYKLEFGQMIRPIIQTMAERLRFTDMRLAELETERIFYAPVNEDRQKGWSLTLRANSAVAVEALAGKSSVEINTFPVYVGRYTRRRADDLFHSNNLFLHDEPPYTISRSHFSIIPFHNDLYFYDRGSTLGTIVNGEQIGGMSRQKKTLLKFGENDLIIGGEKSKLVFKLITRLD